MDKELEMMKNIEIRKLNYLGHLMRNPKHHLLQLVILGNGEENERGEESRDSKTETIVYQNFCPAV